MAILVHMVLLLIASVEPHVRFVVCLQYSVILLEGLFVLHLLDHLISLLGEALLLSCCMLQLFFTHLCFLLLC